MRLWICVALILFLAWLLLKPLIGKSKSLVAATLVMLILIPTAGFEVRWLLRENQGTEVVKIVSGNEEGYLHCQRLTETFMDATQNRGHVMWDEPNKAVIKYTSCQELFGYIESDKTNPTLKQIQAVHILTHETIHVSGDRDERSTECKAVQNDARTAEILGATPEQAQALAETYFNQIYPNMPTSYYDENCVLNP